MILEVAILNVRVGLERESEAAFAQAPFIIASMPGYISHQLQRCIETSNRYALLANWTSIEAHTIGFCGSPEHQRWKKLLHHFLKARLTREFLRRPSVRRRLTAFA
jgi:heme-degrading monooxygenase HmoA